MMSGKAMPVDATPVKRIVVDRHMQGGQVVPVYVSHFETCPGRGSTSKEKGAEMTIGISKKVAEQAIETAKTIFLNYQPDMKAAYENCIGNLNVGLSIVFKPAEESSAIDADIAIRFKVEEINRKSTFSFTDGDSGYGPLFDQFSPARRAYLEILLRDFRPFAERLGRTLAKYRIDIDAVRWQIERDLDPTRATKFKKFSSGSDANNFKQGVIDGFHEAGAGVASVV
jgi:hypothetical protein